MWVKLDDQFFVTGRHVQAGPLGKLVYLAGQCYVAINITDGFIPDTAIPMLLAQCTTTKKAVEKLVELGSWRRVEGGYFDPFYLEANPSSADVQGERDAAQMRMFALRSGGTTEGTTSVRSGSPSPSPSKKRTRANYDEDFDILWAEYPRRKAKADAARAYGARRAAGVPHEELILAVKHYAQECQEQAREEQFMMHGATFFGPRERWKDYLEAPKAAPVPGHNGTPAGYFDRTA